MKTFYNLNLKIITFITIIALTGCLWRQHKANKWYDVATNDCIVNGKIYRVIFQSKPVDSDYSLYDQRNFIEYRGKRYKAITNIDFLGHGGIDYIAKLPDNKEHRYIDINMQYRGFNRGCYVTFPSRFDQNENSLMFGKIKVNF